MEQIETIEGNVENIIYQSDATGFSVFVINRELDEGDGTQEITCTAGTLVNEGEDVRLTGLFVVHPTYGQQFKVQAIERIMPKTVSGMEKYLASGAIKGVGAKRAKLIVDKFGLAAFDVIENEPERLSEIKGITMKLARDIGKEFIEKSAQRNTMMYLQGLGLTVGQSDKICKRYGIHAIDVVKTNPYVLAEDIFGIGFKIADAIAVKAGIPHFSPNRIWAGVKYVLSDALGDGHTYLPKAQLLEKAQGLLALEMAEVENQLLQMQVAGDIKQDKIVGAIVPDRPASDDDTEIVIYLTAYYHGEIYIAKKLLELNTALTDQGDVEADVAEAEREAGITLARLQKTAVQEALTNGVLVITGGPGTGKTTTINTIIRIMRKMGQRIVLCAPTGRAAKRMSETTGMSASTIHRLLGIHTTDSNRPLSKEELPDDMMIQEDCVIVDESSMVDVMLMFRLLKSIKPGTRLILVGDVNQLPSVGAGNVLRDVIESGKVRVVYLDEIFRQSAESAIVMNAHRVNRGDYPMLNEKDSDFFFIQEHDINRAVATVADLAASRLPKFMPVDVMRDIQVLTPQRKSAAGVANLNILLQEALNPPSFAKGEKQMGSFVFRQGDKVMQIKNNYNIQWRIMDDRGNLAEEGCGMFNGDEGIITHIDTAGAVQVRFDDDRLVDYETSQLDELVLAYAITIHKSQGSEYDIVVLPIHSGPPMLLNRNLLYTAITRAKKLVVIVGVAGTLRRMVDNVRESVRYSALKYRIERLHRQMYGDV